MVDFTFSKQVRWSVCRLQIQDWGPRHSRISHIVLVVVPGDNPHTPPHLWSWGTRDPGPLGRWSNIRGSTKKDG